MTEERKFLISGIKNSLDILRQMDLLALSDDNAKCIQDSFSVLLAVLLKSNVKNDEFDALYTLDELADMLNAETLASIAH